MIRSRQTATRGQTLVEFSLVAFLSVMLLLSIVEISRMALVYTTVANAAWKDINLQPGLYKNYAKTYTDRLRQMRLDPAKLGFSGPAEEAWPEVALRFTLSQPGVHCAIIGTTNPDNARKNIESATKGPLPEDVVTKIDEMAPAPKARGPYRKRSAQA